jgi:crotonobetainyl-CoA:carnitine CoA-transferase CaiB-like acyl-CoA transferase
MSTRPLDGKVVVDLTTALSGPYATLLLGGLGARVIKVENPATGGDSSRSNSPYLTDDGLSIKRRAPKDMSISMVLRGRNKESITLDLKTEAGRAVLADLLRNADVLVENYSAGVTTRLGIDYDFARSVNPRLVYTSISGFGSEGGPGSGKAMDTIIQALSGVMMTAGAPGEPPTRFGLPIADLVAPLYGLIGTLAALLQVERTGEGQHVDVSMLGSLTSLLACEPFDAFEMIGLPLRTGQFVPRLAPFGLFQAADGWFAICAPVDHFARGVLKAMDREDLIEDARFATRDGRVVNADALHGLIEEWAKGIKVDEALAQLTRHGAPAAEVLDPARAVRNPSVLKRGEVVRLQGPGLEDDDLYATGMPFLMSGSQLSLDLPAPQLGQHTHEVLEGLLGYSAERVEQLQETGVV